MGMFVGGAWVVRRWWEAAADGGVEGLTTAGFGGGGVGVGQRRGGACRHLQRASNKNK